MSDRSTPRDVLLGLIRLREHCAFTWEEPVTGGARVALVQPIHCRECVAELLRLGYIVSDKGREDGSTREH
jgi:hypothetical protein